MGGGDSDGKGTVMGRRGQRWGELGDSDGRRGQ